MRDEEFLKKYEELLDKGYCDCNEMNCIDNNSSRRILNIAKRLQLEEDDLLKENRKLRKKLENSFSYEDYAYQVNKKIELLRERQELTECLKDLIENRFTNGKVVWFDSEYARDFGELCSMAGAGDTRLALVPLSEIENILSKIEKR